MWRVCGLSNTREQGVVCDCFCVFCVFSVFEYNLWFEFHQYLWFEFHNLWDIIEDFNLLCLLRDCDLDADIFFIIFIV